MSAIVMRDELIESVRTLLADPVVYPGTAYAMQVRSVEMFGGALTESDRPRYLTNPPCVFIGVTGTSPVDYIEEQTHGGDVQPRFIVVVAVIAKDIPAPGRSTPLHRSDVALAVAEKIADHVIYNRPASSTTDIRRFRMDNLWSVGNDKDGIGMWALQWEQGTSIAPVDADDLPDLITIRDEYTIAENGDEPQMVGNTTFEVEP